MPKSSESSKSSEVTATSVNNVNVFKLSNSDIVIGSYEQIDENTVRIFNPCGIYTVNGEPCVMPYDVHLLINPMKSVDIRLFDVMYNKKLSEFEIVQEQYNNLIQSLNQSVITEQTEKIIL